METSPFLTRPLALIDCVPWAPEYPVDHPLRHVPGWYSKALDIPENKGLIALKAEDVSKKLDLESVCGVIISGSPRDAWGDDPINQVLTDLLGECRRIKKPVLGVCFGHQLLARAFGGRVARHEKGLQLGNVRVTFNSDARDCPLFSGVQTEQTFLCGHADCVYELPPGARRLASSDVTSVQAFQLDEVLFGVQFHPEFTPDILRFLWEVRIPVWQANVSFDIGHVLDQLTAAPASVSVLKNFARFCLLKR